MYLKGNKLFWLNNTSLAAEYQVLYAQKLKDAFKKDLVGLEVGSAYGGGVEYMGWLWKDIGKVYGYDTFEGHPKDLSDDQNSHEATCMDMWYTDMFNNMNQRTYEYQRKVLDEEGLDNVTLVKGRVNEHSFDDIKEAHYVLFDMDLVKPTKVAYKALKDKIVKGGYLLFHDAIPADHLPLLHKFIYEEVVKDGWLIVEESPPAYLTILQKI
jgi:hypothetical protein